MAQAKATAGRIEFDRLPDSALIRLNQLLAGGLLPFSTSTAWRKAREGKFPRPLKISTQVTAWRVGDVRAWLNNPGNYRHSGSQGNGRAQVERASIEVAE